MIKRLLLSVVMLISLIAPAKAAHWLTVGNLGLQVIDYDLDSIKRQDEELLGAVAYVDSKVTYVQNPSYKEAVFSLEFKCGTDQFRMRAIMAHDFEGVDWAIPDPHIDEWTSMARVMDRDEQELIRLLGMIACGGTYDL
jgi:hypothetical protein